MKFRLTISCYTYSIHGVCIANSNVKRLRFTNLPWIMLLQHNYFSNIDIMEFYSKTFGDKGTWLPVINILFIPSSPPTQSHRIHAVSFILQGLRLEKNPRLLRFKSPVYSKTKQHSTILILFPNIKIRGDKGTWTPGIQLAKLAL